MQRQEQQGPRPAFRVWMCGSFRLERLTGSSYEQVQTPEWGGSNYPRLLFKALLCSPGRQRRRESLIEQLWPDVDPEQGVRYLNTATTKLRRLLQPDPELPSLLVSENDFTFYRLAGQAELWTDVDAALSALVQAEQIGRTTAEALPFLQEAVNYFNQGALLQEEEGEWVAARRATVEQSRYRARLWLAEAAEQQNLPGQAETVLATLREEDPLDEDVLVRLMGLLHRQGMTHKALELYRRTSDVFIEEGLELAETTTQFARQLLHSRMLSPSLNQQTSLGASPFSLTTTQDIMEAGRQREGVSHLDTTRRRLLEQAVPFFLGASGVLLNGPLMKMPSSTPADELAFYAVAIPACWTLVYQGGIEYVEQVLPIYLTHLSTLAQTVFPDRKQAARLASQGHKLANLLDLRREDFGAALQQSKRALFYGQMAEDPNLQAAALIEEALTFQYRKQLTHTLTSYQKAFEVIEGVREASPIIKGRIYGGLALASARRGQEQEALRYLDLAAQTFPEHPENDSAFPYTHYSQYYLSLYEGLMYTELQRPKQALVAYAHLQQVEYAPRRVEIATNEAAAFLLLGDLEQAREKLERAITGALATNSRLRYSEASEVYQRMQQKWPQERTVKALNQFFQREARG